MKTNTIPYVITFTEHSFTIDLQDDLILDSKDAISTFLINYKKNRYTALYEFGFKELDHKASHALTYLHHCAEVFIKELTNLSELEIARELACVELSEQVWEQLNKTIPFAIGSEFITKEWMSELFAHLQEAYATELSSYQGSVKLYLAEKSQQLHVPERIFFHLVESNDENYPFAFMATYATKLEDGKIKHMPLKYALVEFKEERDKLLSLLSCLNKAAEVSPLINSFVESGEMFHTLRLTAEEAYELLCAVEEIKQCGILCRVPNWWRKQASHVSLSIKLGDEKPSLLGFDALLETQPSLVVDGVKLSETDIKKLLAQTEGLAYLKGKWIEVNHAQLQRLLDRFHHSDVELTLLDAFRQLDDDPDNGYTIENGTWLSNLFDQMRTPNHIQIPKLPNTFHATLRPYQEVGFSWLSYMKNLGFGACLADDMGLGKTIQVLAFLETLRKQQKDAKVLLIVPASLLGNWEKECQKFAPNMSIHILHGRSTSILKEEVRKLSAFLTITTYGMVNRIEELQDITWTCVIIDEAQAIKNPLTKQTKAVKALPSLMRIAMTGTPIENDLTNLWSLFDFLNKGLLGSSNEFKEFVKGIEEHPEQYGKLKSMISPFMLRRLKTDRTIISDLPEKLEMIDYVKLSKQQVILYHKYLQDLETKLKESEGIERRGLILGALTKLKQICNHPDQYLGEESYIPKESGKFEMLKELCETIAEKHERVLVFTQFKEITPYLSDYLAKIFNRKGYIIHGGISPKHRTEMVEKFNSEAYVPYIVLSVKAAGTGLNLTSANHVIHFDRWWNPAVENQATDRAFRIGQKKNVMVHKLVCEGTIEEKIDAMINSKVELANSVIGTSSSAKWLNEMNNEELMSLLSLDER